MTGWETIQATFLRLRDFVFTDLSRLVDQPDGGNFATVALVMTACDALGRLRYGKDGGDRIFKECLPPEWQSVAPVLYDALRHGFVHDYEAMSVVAHGKPVHFEIAWSGDRHLTFPNEDRTVLCIVARDLVQPLRAAFDSVEAELCASKSLRDEFFMRDQKGRKIELRGGKAQQWADAVIAARVVPRPPASPSGSAGPSHGGGEGATGPRGYSAAAFNI